jgi:2-iminobutanoate/2-iminopropanoate deaminase
MDVIRTDDAPGAVGAYSQGVVTQDRIQTSGQIGIDPRTGELVEDSIEAELQQCLQNVLAVVRAGGGNPSSVVKTRVFLVDLEYYPDLNRLYEDHFDDPLPARTVVGGNELPRGARFEIEALAQVDSG